MQTVVVRTQPTRPRRRNRRRGGGGGGPIGGNRRSLETFDFSINGLKANSKGCLKFGPNLVQSKAFSDGVLKAYHEYKIINVELHYKSATKTTNGTIYYEVDTACEQTALSSKLNQFTCTESGRKAFAASVINGQNWVKTNKDQFWLLYEGDGSGDIAGNLIIRMRCSLQSTK